MSEKAHFLLSFLMTRSKLKQYIIAVRYLPNSNSLPTQPTRDRNNEKHIYIYIIYIYIY